jgi:hypothetical protein
MSELLIPFIRRQGGLHCSAFEMVYSEYANRIWSDEYDTIVFSFASDVFYLVDGALQILTLANYLVKCGKVVRLEFDGLFSDGKSYLERLGFFDKLDPSIGVSPFGVQGTSLATVYGGQSNNLVEIHSIEPTDVECEKFFSIPIRVAECVESAFEGLPIQASVKTACMTLVSELGQNIILHSKTRIDGFIALQKFQTNLKIAVSDCGSGILDTIKPVLKEQRLKDLADSELLLEMFNRGKISRTGDGGSGLYTSAQQSLKFKAEMWLRLPTCQVYLRPEKKGYGVASFKENAAYLPGTHFSFRYLLTE